MTMRISFNAMGVASIAVIAVSLTGGAITAWAQKAATSPFDARIAREVNAIHTAELDGEAEAKLGAMWGLLGSDYQSSVQPVQAERAYSKALHLLKTSQEGRANYATVLDDLGSLYMQLGRLDDAESLRRRALEMRIKSGDGLAVATSEGHVAEVELARHRFDAATRDAQHALAGFIAADDPDMSDRLAVMITLTYALCSEQRCAEGLRVADEASSIASTGFQPNSLPMAQTLLVAGYAHWKSGEIAEAEQAIRQGIDAVRQAVPSGSPILLSALLEYKAFLQAERPKAEIAAIDRELDGAERGMEAVCKACTVSAYALLPRR